MTDPVSIVIADDHPLFREGARETLIAFTDCEIVEECDNADDAVRSVIRHLPDIVLLDISMPGGGIEAASRIAAACPAVKILMLTASEDGGDLTKALEIGACGYVLKGVGGEQLAHIIKSVHEGVPYVPPALAARMLAAVRNNNTSAQPDRSSELTAREEKILERVARGESNKEVALALRLSEVTVKRYMTNIMRKLQVRNRVEAALKAHNYGFSH